MHKLTSDEEKQVRIAELFPVLMKYPNLMKFFDIRSNKLLDEKIDDFDFLNSVDDYIDVDPSDPNYPIKRDAVYKWIEDVKKNRRA